MNWERPQRKRIEISLIPLIDVAFFLLIFFMLAGTVEKIEIIPVEPPEAQSGKLMDEGHIVIVLGKYDEVIVGDEIIEMSEMQKILAPSLKANPNKVITVKADARVPANRVIDLMDAIKRAGGKNLSIVTQSREVSLNAE